MLYIQFNWRMERQFNNIEDGANEHKLLVKGLIVETNDFFRQFTFCQHPLWLSFLFHVVILSKHSDHWRPEKIRRPLHLYCNLSFYFPIFLTFKFLHKIQSRVKGCRSHSQCWSTDFRVDLRLQKQLWSHQNLTLVSTKLKEFEA